MKYSMMSLMVDSEIKLKKPSFIHMAILGSLGYQGQNPTIDEALEFINAHGIPMKNGTMEFEDLVKLAKDSGYDGLDLMSYHFEISGSEAKAILEKYGITLSAVDLIMPFANASDETKYQTMLSRAKAMIDKTAEAGCKKMLLMPTVYTFDEGITTAEAFDNFTRGLRDCVAYGKEKGVTVNTETLESIDVPYCTCDEMEKIFKAVPELKYTHDTGNPVVGLEDPVATYEKFRDRVETVHFKEYGYVEKGERPHVCRDGKKVDNVPFGEGIIDFQTHLKMLKRDGYDGYIALEGTVAAENCIQGVKGAVSFFRKMEEAI